MSTEGTLPSEGPSRLGRHRMVALDAARGLAVIGMIAVNTDPRGDDELLEMLSAFPMVEPLCSSSFLAASGCL